MGQYGAVLKEKQWKHLFLPKYFCHHHFITPLDREAAVALTGNLLLSTCIVSVGLTTTVCTQIGSHRHWHQYR